MMSTNSPLKTELVSRLQKWRREGSGHQLWEEREKYKQAEGAENLN